MPEAIEVMFKGRRLAYFVNPERVLLSAGDHVIVEAERGIDMGEVRHLAVDTVPTERDKRFRAVVRRARPEDFRELERIRADEEEATNVCKERIKRLGLDMKLVDTEFQIDGNRITFYFTAEKRVDFRELVKELAGVFKTRIELRQIGARDAAKRLGGIGPCGREYCCSTWLKEFSPVTLKMAKNQGLALAPSKISGGCGRLMCCLMYEDPFYKEMVRLFPKSGYRFEIDGTPMRVFQNDFFREVVKARDEAGEVHEWPITEFPVPRERWGGAVRPKGAPSRGGSGSGCHKPDPKPIGMRNARGARDRGDDAGERQTRGGPDAQSGEATGAPPGTKGAPFMHGGRRRGAGAGDASDAPPDTPPPPPAEMVRLEAQRRRRQDGEELGSGADRPTEREVRDSDLVASADPPEKTGKPEKTGAEEEKPRPRGRRRRRGRRRPRGGGGSSTS